MVTKELKIGPCMPVLTSVLFCEGVSDQSLLTHVCFVLAIQDWSMNSHSLCQASLDLSMYACPVLFV